MSTQQNILITGATGSIGCALAHAYAAPGITLWLQGRQQDLLDQIASECQAKGAAVHCRTLDVTDLDTLTAWVHDIDQAHGIDLMICGAGININIGEDQAGETWEDTDRLLDINVRAVMAMVHAVLPGMRRRKRGQIALISSLAAYFGLPVTPAYCASKAAIKAYGEALRGWLAPEGIRVSVIMPGYVDSKMCREMPGPKPFLWNAKRAAAVIRRGLQANRARIQFPLLLATGTWFLAVFPAAVSQRLVRWFKYI